MPLKQVDRRALDELCADADPRLVWHRQLLRACTPHDGEALGVCVMGGVARKARLADPRLAGEQYHLTLPRARQLRRFLERRTLLYAPHVLHRWDRPQ